VTAAKTSSDGAPPATSVAKRRSAACSSATTRDSSVLNGAPDHLPIALLRASLFGDATGDDAQLHAQAQDERTTASPPARAIIAIFMTCSF
jgi:hypothetical protein